MKKAFRRIRSRLSLNVIASVIAIGIFALSLNMLWESRQDTWREAEQSSRNLLTAVIRDIGGNIRLYDLFLQGVINRLATEGFQELPQQIQHQILFDYAAATGYMRPILILNAAGDIVADASSVMPRAGNFADRDYFKVHKEHADVGLHVSRPYRNRLRDGEWSIAISRRISDPNGQFAGIVSTALPLAKIGDSFAKLQLGREGTITLLRGDGILLTRRPFDENDIDRDLSKSPNISRVMRENSGEFVGISMIDGVRRHFVFAHVDGLPLIVQVAMSVDEIFERWRQKAFVLSLITLMLCSAVVALTFMFQRELRRRTLAEAELATLAATDGLTNLPNRRAFDEYFKREWNDAVRTQAPLSLLFIDADNFKNYNDHYGHGEGDVLLGAIADVLRTHLRRPRDYAARYGGEEFTVLMPETDQKGALVVAERIRQAILALGMPHEKSRHGVLTVSIGVGTAFPAPGNHPSLLFRSADAALYRAKAAGRNVVKSSSLNTRFHVAGRGGPDERMPGALLDRDGKGRVAANDAD